MFLRRLSVGLLLLTVFATMGKIIYDVIERGSVVPAAPPPTSTPFIPPTAAPTQTPLPTASPLPPPTATIAVIELEPIGQSDLSNVYILQENETITDVAERYGISPEQLAEYNQLSSIDVILGAGSELNIPANQPTDQSGQNDQLEDQP